MKKLFLSLVAVFVFSGLAMASITPALDGGAPTGPVAGVWTWTYSISVDGNESLNPSANAGATCLGGQTPCNTFWTLYDVGGLISSTEATPGGWGWVENAVGITPGGQLITDSPSYLNITFYYTGVTQTGPITSIDGFSFESSESSAIRQPRFRTASRIKVRAMSIFRRQFRSRPRCCSLGADLSDSPSSAASVPVKRNFAGTIFKRISRA